MRKPYIGYEFENKVSTCKLSNDEKKILEIDGKNSYYKTITTKNTQKYSHFTEYFNA